MGVPAFNVIMGPVGGYYMGMRLRAKIPTKMRLRKFRQTGLFTALILAVACAASLMIAWLDPSLKPISAGCRLAQP
jgi:small neutral amino acid transporter SnatA (MarC family)